MDIVDLLHQDGVENPGGIATIHGFALVSDFLTIQKVDKLDAVGATPESVSKILTPHVFNAGKSMKKLYSTLMKGSLKSAVVGDYDGIGKKTTAVFFVPGKDAKTLAMCRLLENSNAIYFVTLTDEDVMQVGDEYFPAKTKTEFDSANNEGVRGTMITVETYARIVEYVPGLNFTPAVAQSQAAVITTQPGGFGAAAGQNVQIKVVATNAASYKWYKDGVELLGINADNLTFINAQAGDAGTYHVVVTGLDAATVTSVDAILTVT